MSLDEKLAAIAAGLLLLLSEGAPDLDEEQRVTRLLRKTAGQ